jgi:putative membrane protein
MLGALAVVAVAAPASVSAHTGEPLVPHDLWRAWAWNPGIVIPLALSASWYAVGLRALWREAGAGRGVRIWEAGAFGAGWTFLVIALVSPLHPLGEALFSAHMVQHELMMAISAPLLVLGRPLVPFLWALPISARRRAGAWAKTIWLRRSWDALTRPFVAWLLHGATLWVWHAPRLYEATLSNELVHSAQHLSFLATALLFWWSLIHGREHRLGYGAAVLYLFTTALHSGALGALLTFADTPWYSAYTATTPRWGLTPLEDQQLAGLVMWIPATMAYLVAALLLFVACLRESEWRVRQHEAAMLPPQTLSGADA